VQGCLAWQRDGLRPPAEVVAATNAYRTEQDLLGAFIADCCRVAERFEAMATDLYRTYCGWCAENGEHPVAQRRFGMSLTKRGFLSERNSQSGRKQWRGIGLTERTERTEPDFPIDGNNAFTKRLIRKVRSVRSVRSVHSAARLWNWQAVDAPEPEPTPYDCGELADESTALAAIESHYRRPVAVVWPVEEHRP